jgi:hypothetical protein
MRLEPTAPEVERVAGLRGPGRPLAGRERVDEVREEPGRDGRGAVGLDLAGHPVRDADLEVRRRQLEAGVLGASRTLASTGSVLRLRDRARLTTDRPRARFSCMTESFTSCVTPLARARGARGPAVRIAAWASVGGWIFSLSSHSVITVIMVWTAWTVVRLSCGAAVDDPGPDVEAAADRWPTRGRPVDGASGQKRPSPGDSRGHTTPDIGPRRAGAASTAQSGYPPARTCPHGTRHAWASLSGRRPAGPRSPPGGSARRRRVSRSRSARGPPRSRGAARRWPASRG